MVFEPVKLELKSAEMRIHFDEGVSSDIYLDNQECFALTNYGSISKVVEHPDGRRLTVKINK